jgi:hypothetical protein
MQTLKQFIEKVTAEIGIALPTKWTSSSDIEVAQLFLKGMNEFFFQTYPGIGKTGLDGDEQQYFSEFHKFWEKHHKEILNPRINRAQARCVAECLSEAIKAYGGSILEVANHTHGIPGAAVAQVRFFTANQDFRELPKDSYGAYLKDSTRFDANEIYRDPARFLQFIGVTRNSQNDKRMDFAKNAATFLIDRNISAFQIAPTFQNDARLIRQALMDFPNMGYAFKKANMFVRDMVELKVWPVLANFEVIDVASDRNVMKLALRTRILETDIPLLSSFLDIFGYQYSCVDEMSANAWRAVWEEWRNFDVSTAPAFPCRLDFLLFRIGREYCKDNLVEYECEHGHKFFNFNALAKLCRICKQNKARGKATPVRWMLPCQVNASELPREDGVLMLKAANLLRVFNGSCIFEKACQPKQEAFQILDPPKSISIIGQTGWTRSYASRERGGGGMMG